MVAIAFALWKIVVAPRSFIPAGTQHAPFATYERLDGGKFAVARERGHVLFLDFFATWCEPCKVELPMVMAWSRRNPGARVVFVDVGESRALVAPFARRYVLKDVALDQGLTARAHFNIVGFPTLVVIDPKGYVRAKWEGFNPAVALAMSNAESRLR